MVVMTPNIFYARDEHADYDGDLRVVYVGFDIGLKEIVALVDTLEGTFKWTA